MNYSDKKFIEKIEREIKQRIPYPAKVEDFEFIETIRSMCFNLLSVNGYHIAKHYNKKGENKK